MPVDIKRTSENGYSALSHEDSLPDVLRPHRDMFLHFSAIVRLMLLFYFQFWVLTISPLPLYCLALSSTSNYHLYFDQHSFLYIYLHKRLKERNWTSFYVNLSFVKVMIEYLPCEWYYGSWLNTTYKRLRYHKSLNRIARFKAQSPQSVRHQLRPSIAGMPEWGLKTLGKS